MDNEIETKNYELAFHVNPDMEEADVRKRVQEVYDLVTQSGGTILTSTEPKRVHLSYPIKHKGYAFFCVVSFTAEADAIKKINSQIKLHAEVLRHVLVSLPRAGKEVRALGAPRIRQMKPRMAADSVKDSPERPVLKEKEASSEKELDKEIEEAIKDIE